MKANLYLLAQWPFVDIWLIGKLTMSPYFYIKTVRRITIPQPCTI